MWTGAARLDCLPGSGHVVWFMQGAGWVLRCRSLEVRLWELHALCVLGFPMAYPTAMKAQHREVFINDILPKRANSHTFWQRVCRIHLDTHPSISTLNSRIRNGIYF